MIFNSIAFLYFLPIVFVVFWSLQKAGLKVQNFVILAASYFFYGWWDARFLALIAFSTLVDYFLGIKMHESVKGKYKKLFLYLSLAMNLGLLGFFKYFNFFVDSFITALDSVGIAMDTWSLNIILPVGISFYTFQTLSYSIDIYKGKITPTKDLIGFAAFVSFFPQLVAGPIERASHLLPQFQSKRKFVYEDAMQGTLLILYGFFKKVVIADRLAPYVNNVFDNYANYNTPSLIIASVFFSFQIYCDFSGYSLIARGIAKLFGYDLMVNFNRPYLSRNFSEFWKRWHISLSSWFRDYVYIPLGGNRVSKLKVYRNLMIVFLVSGLWHGANWTFVVWGGLHGLYLIINQLIGNKVRVPKIAQILIVYTFVVFAWIFFRANTVQDAFAIMEKVVALDFAFNLNIFCAYKGVLNLFLSFFVLGLLALSYGLPKDLKFDSLLKNISFGCVMLFLIFILGVNEKTEFIYFQF